MRINIIDGNKYSGRELFALTFLRLLVGWHFLYEGLVKLYTPGWSAKSYLAGSVGPLSSFFEQIMQSVSFMKTVDSLNIWGLTLIGLSLFTGLFAKFSECLGILLLLLYYLAYPPFAGYSSSAFTEGNYWIVDKNLIEMGALLVLIIFQSSHLTGLDRFIVNSRYAASGFVRKLFV